MVGGKASLCFLSVQVALLLMHSPVHPAHAGQGAVYIGSEACGECHPDQYESYKDNSKKADSFTSIKKMAAKLTPAELGECFGCHTTGDAAIEKYRVRSLPRTRQPACRFPGPVGSECPTGHRGLQDLPQCRTGRRLQFQTPGLWRRSLRKDYLK